MMNKLDELEKLAKRLQDSYPDRFSACFDWATTVNPDTVLKLIAVARAADKIWDNSICDCSPVGRCSRCKLKEAIMVFEGI